MDGHSLDRKDSLTSIRATLEWQFLFLSLMNRTAGRHQSLPIVIEHANCADSENLTDAHSRLPIMRVDFSVPTSAGIGIKSVAILTIHFGLY